MSRSQRRAAHLLPSGRQRRSTTKSSGSSWARRSKAPGAPLLTEQGVSVGAWTRKLPGFRRLRGDDEGVGAPAHEGWPSRSSSERRGITSGGTLHPRAGHDGELLRRAERRPHRALGFGQRAAHRQSAARIGGTCGVPRGRLKRCRGSHRRSRDARHDRARREAEREWKASRARGRRSDRSRGGASHGSGARADAGACSSRTPAARALHGRQRDAGSRRARRKMPRRCEVGTPKQARA